MTKQATNERRQKLISLLATLSETVNELDELWRDDTDAETEGAMEPLRGRFDVVARGSYFAMHVEEWKDQSTEALQGLIAESEGAAQ